jgi:hypothetical protein
MRLGFAIVIAVGGCGSKPVAPIAGRDMTVSAVDKDMASGNGSVQDLATRDLTGHGNAATYDLAWTACAGSRLANTCVETFFAQFVSCFDPSGSCQKSGTTTKQVTWANGAYVSQQLMPNVGIAEWGVGQTRCMTYYPSGKMTGQSGNSFTYYCLGADINCYDMTTGKTTANGLMYDSSTGTYTCADGTQVKPDTSQPVCAVLDELLGAGKFLCM